MGQFNEESILPVLNSLLEPSLVEMAMLPARRRHSTNENNYFFSQGVTFPERRGADPAAPGRRGLGDGDLERPEHLVLVGELHRLRVLAERREMDRP
ncbi:MAG TPA: hypothetical protein VGJ22_08130 [Anaerolineales bacterium]